MDMTSYQPDLIEQKIYAAWEAAGYFAPSKLSQAISPFCIMLPPPNVTGSLHMGHGFQDTLMDILTRYHRMCGDSALWQPGVDHAGIATQMVVERQLEAEGLSRTQLGREKFVQKVFEWKDISGGWILKQMRRMGASCDWDAERFTMDEGLSNAVQEVFIKLYEDNLIYRGTRLVNWDPKLKTAVSDLEVINTQEDGFLWHIQYLTENTALPINFITVATTRPETLLGDVAVAVNPNDERYQSLIGQKLRLPLTDRLIPIIADDYVDPEFGTGAVKITPAHDFNDYQVGQRHGLELINIFNDDATLNSSVPKIYQNLDRFEARKKILQDLESQNLLVKTQPHVLSVPRAERGNTIIEPRLSAQWYVKISPLAEPAIEVVKSGKIKFVPENGVNLYYRWMENIQDWCISRQLWWGHRIPAWYDESGNIYVGRSEQEIRQKHQLPDTLKLSQDNDVLDTWFSSALWPFSTLGWPEKTDRLANYYPTSVLVTGFDILFFWVARMIMFGLKFAGDVPFRTVYLHGLIRDHEGQKMSKSKGNVLDPVDLIDGIDLEKLISKRTDHLMIPSQKEKIIKATRKQFPEGIKAYGCDALRLTYAALASTSRDILFDVARMEGYRNFCNKLFNATRYVLMNTENKDCGIQTPKSFSLADHWILSKLDQAIDQAHRAISEFRFDHLVENLYSFVWGEYCDWYLELSKVVLNKPDYSEQQKAGTRYTLLTVLETILKLLHPVIPFMTEHLWQEIKKITDPEDIAPASIMITTYPKSTGEIHTHAVNSISWLQSVITQIRTIRSELNIPPKQTISLWVENAYPEQLDQLNQFSAYLSELCKVTEIAIMTDASEATAHAVLGNLTLHIPMAGLIDLEKEKERLLKNLEKIDTQIISIQQKLSNPLFADKAPPTVVQKERERLVLLENEKASFKDQLQKIKI